MLLTDHRNAARSHLVFGLRTLAGRAQRLCALIVIFYVGNAATLLGQVAEIRTLNEIAQDFDDIHPFVIYFDDIRGGGNPYSGAVDVADIIWLGDADVESDQEDEVLDPSQAAIALRIGDWQKTGFDGGPTRPMLRFSPSDISIAPQMVGIPTNSKRNGVGIVYGMRMIEREYGFYVSAKGSILHDAYWDTEAENHIMGPQLGLIALRNSGPWSVRLQATAMAGLNYGDVQQSGRIGEGRVPGGVNQLLYARPVEFNHLDPHNEISPSGELRAEAYLRLTNSVTLALTWSGIAINNALLTEDRIRYRLPDLGLVDPGEQQIFASNLFCGVSMVR
jgi:hypothetical protein